MKSLKFSLIIGLITICSNTLFAQDSLATVHFYRNSAAGYAIPIKLYQGDVEIGTLNVGNVITIRCKPGQNQFWARTESERSIFLDLKPGLVYFVECRIAAGTIIGVPFFRQVKIEDAKKDLISINSYLEQLFTPGLEETVLPNDTVRALYNLYARKQKSGKNLATVFGVIGAVGLISVASSGDFSALPGLAIPLIFVIGGAKKTKRYDKVALAAMLQDYQEGKPLPIKLKSKLKEKDFR
jgi:hypothetical protein